MKSRDELKEIYKFILDQINFDLWIDNPSDLNQLFNLIFWVNYCDEYRDFVYKSCKEANEKYGETIFPSNMIDYMDPDGLFEDYLNDRFGQGLQTTLLEIDDGLKSPLLCRSKLLSLDFTKYVTDRDF